MLLVLDRVRSCFGFHVVGEILGGIFQCLYNNLLQAISKCVFPIERVIGAKCALCDGGCLVASPSELNHLPELTS
eukprot:12266357-Ditylum_brightwellii.AAC.1